MQHFPKSREAIYRNLKRHHPRQRPDYNTDNSYGDAGDRQARFAPTRKVKETQTGEEFQKEHKHDQRKHLFDRNLFENYESSLTSIRHKSILNEVGDPLNAAPVQEDSDEVVTEQPKRKGIMKYDSKANSSHQTDSEAMVEKFEKHIATVEFEDHLSNDMKKQKDEQEETLVTTIDMEGRKRVEMSHPESKTDISKLVTSSKRSPLKSPSTELKEVKLGELHYHEMGQKKRDTELDTVVDMDQDEDGEHTKLLKQTISHFKNQKETEKLDLDDDEKEDKEKEITTINIDQERRVLQLGQSPVNHTKSADDIHPKEKSVEKLVTTIDIDQENVSRHLSKSRSKPTNKEEKSAEQLITTIDIGEEHDNAKPRDPTLFSPINKELDHKVDSEKKSSEKLITFIDMDREKEKADLSYAMVPQKTKPDNKPNPVNDSRHRLSKSPSTDLEGDKLVEVLEHDHEIEQKNKRDEQFITLVDMDLNEDNKETAKEFRRSEELINALDANQNLKQKTSNQVKGLIEINTKLSSDTLKVAYDDKVKKEADIKNEKIVTEIDLGRYDQDKEKDEKLVTTINIDEDNVMPPKREEHIQHRLRISSEENLELSKKTVKEDLKNDKELNKVPSIPHNSISDVVVYESNEKDDEMSKDATVEATKYVTMRRVKYLEEDDIDKPTDKDDKSVRTNQNSTTVSFKEDTTAKKSEDT